MQSTISRLRARVEERTTQCDTLTEADMWQTHGAVVWEAKRFIGEPVFYPVYRSGSLYSHSPLAIILKKGFLRLNRDVARAASEPDFQYFSGLGTLDSDTRRIGRAHRCEFTIRDVNQYADQIAEALVEDTSRIESANPDATNVVLCGGRDSLNLLLLPWANPTVAASAEPNYDLVCRFVADNGLDCSVHLLDDEIDETALEHEILENCCRANLGHWRWGAGLRRLAQAYGNKVIFWKGQVGDLYMAPTWKGIMHERRPVESLLRRAYKRLERPLPFVVNRAIGRSLQPGVIQTTWDRCAMLQGAHMGFIREITDALVLSAYHGPSIVRVWEQADLGSVALRDMRHLVAERLRGCPPRYPSRNPAPPLSALRVGLAHPDRFLPLVEAGGIRVDR